MGARVIGLTGGIGMGKSTAAGILSSLGIPTLDTDDLAREEVAPGSPGLAQVAAHFGPSILDENGALRRADLGERVFRTPADRLALEAILHPRIQRRWQRQVTEWREHGVPLGCVVIPLLFEKDYASRFDAVVTVACSVATQSERVTARGWTVGQLRLRQEAQWSVERKLAGADFVVWSEGTLEVHRRQWGRILAGIGERESVTGT